MDPRNPNEDVVDTDPMTGGDFEDLMEEVITTPPEDDEPTPSGGSED